MRHRLFDNGKAIKSSRRSKIFYKKEKSYQNKHFRHQPPPAHNSPIDKTNISDVSSAMLAPTACLAAAQRLPYVTDADRKSCNSQTAKEAGFASGSHMKRFIKSFAKWTNPPQIFCTIARNSSDIRVKNAH